MLAMSMRTHKCKSWQFAWLAFRIHILVSLLEWCYLSCTLSCCYICVLFTCCAEDMVRIEHLSDEVPSHAGLARRPAKPKRRQWQKVVTPKAAEPISDGPSWLKRAMNGVGMATQVRRTGGACRQRTFPRHNLVVYCLCYAICTAGHLKVIGRFIAAKHIFIENGKWGLDKQLPVFVVHWEWIEISTCDQS